MSAATDEVRLPVPAAAQDIPVNVHRAPVLQQEPPVSPANRLRPPPLVLDAPRLDDSFDSTAFDNYRCAVLVRLHVDWPGLVEGTELASLISVGQGPSPDRV